MPAVTEFFARKVVLVTGGAGAVGSNLVAALSAAGPRKIIILDDFSSGYEWNLPDASKVQVVRGDVRDDGALKQVFSERPHIVYHLAAHFANQNSVDHPEDDLLVNGMGTLKLLEYANLVGIDRFIYASSGCGVYGPETPMPFTEEGVSLDLHTPYQVTKLLGELYTGCFYNLYKVPIVNARFFNSYGPGEVPGKYRNVIPNFFYWAMQGEPLPITGTGEETRDFTYVGDIVDGLIAAAHHTEAVGEAINLASGKEVRILDLANLVNEYTGNRAGVVIKERRSWDKKPRLLASIEKARKILRYEPKVDIQQGLRHVHQWFEKHWKRIEAAARF